MGIYAFGAMATWSRKKSTRVFLNIMGSRSQKSLKHDTLVEFAIILIALTSLCIGDDVCWFSTVIIIKLLTTEQSLM